MSGYDTTDENGLDVSRELTAFQRDLLRVVASEGPCRGYRFRERLGERGQDVSHGRLYPNLDQLDALGLIDKQRSMPDNRSNQYRITADGRDVLRALADAYADVCPGAVIA